MYLYDIFLIYRIYAEKMTQLKKCDFQVNLISYKDSSKSSQIKKNDFLWAMK